MSTNDVFEMEKSFIRRFKRNPKKTIQKLLLSIDNHLTLLFLIIGFFVSRRLSLNDYSMLSDEKTIKETVNYISINTEIFLTNIIITVAIWIFLVPSVIVFIKSIVLRIVKNKVISTRYLERYLFKNNPTFSGAALVFLLFLIRLSLQY